MTGQYPGAITATLIRRSAGMAPGVEATTATPACIASRTTVGHRPATLKGRRRGWRAATPMSSDRGQVTAVTPAGNSLLSGLETASTNRGPGIVEAFATTWGHARRRSPTSLWGPGSRTCRSARTVGAARDNRRTDEVAYHFDGDLEVRANSLLHRAAHGEYAASAEQTAAGRRCRGHRSQTGASVAASTAHEGVVRSGP